jgi:hypothetical protein
VIAETAIPVDNGRWELRSSGLWVDLVTETPSVHWSYGLEAFALAIDRPDELLGRGYGHRTPLGWELEFESDPARLDRPAPGVEHQPGRVDGLLLTAPDGGQGPRDGEPASEGPGGGEVPLAGPAERRSWAPTDPGPAGGTGVGGTGTADVGFGPCPGLERWRPELAAPAGAPIEIALPLEPTDAGPGSVWLVGHDGTRLTSRLVPRGAPVAPPPTAQPPAQRPGHG